MIEKYLDHTLTEPEKTVLDEQRQNDPQLNALIHDMSLMVEGIRHSASKSTEQEKLERLAFFAEVMDMEEKKEEESGEEERNVIPLYRKTWFTAAAATVLLFTTAAYFMLTYDRTPLNERLFATYFEAFDNPGSGMTRGANEENLKTRAYRAYDAKNYLEAANLFEQILKDTDDPIMHLCLGNAYLAQGNVDKAEASFNHILEKHTDLVTQAKWYLALTYLKQNKLERARARLWEISDSSMYGEKARKILNKLD
jgi:tetratricopeptide (TPR) repeat protein